jgi:release factor glutamine methyltransferase
MILLSLNLKPYAEVLQKSGIERPWYELRLLIANECRCRYEDVLFADIDISEQQLQSIEKQVNRRANHEPLSKIIGKANFWKNTFYTTKDTLDPRPESEFFIEAVLKYYRNKNLPLTFLDLGTGTGCLLLSCLAEYQNASGVGVDQCSKALLVAKQNAENLNLEKRAHFHKSFWNYSVDGIFDVVLCNPPYIKDAEQLPMEVSWDPCLALYGGCDGLCAYKEIFPMLHKNTYAKSIIFIEIGLGQKHDVCKLATTEHLRLIDVIPDLQNIPRILVFDFV